MNLRDDGAAGEPAAHPHRTVEASSNGRPDAGRHPAPNGSRTPPADAGEEQRLHPLTFVVGAVRELIALVAAAATGLLVGGLSTAFYFALTGLAFGLLFHVASWVTFTYVLYGDRIEFRRALIGRSVKSIPRDRIRGVDITASLPHRLLGLAVVHIDAGADGGEGSLNAVTRKEAERLRGVLLARDAPAPPRRVLARMRRRWYVYAPLSGAYLFTPFALAGSLLGTAYNLGDDLGLITRERVENLGHDVVGLPTALVVALTILVLIAMPVMSVIVFTLFNWDFTVHERDGSVVAERGLVTRRSVSLERRRLRGVELADNPFERVAGVTRLGALITGLGDAAHRGRLLPAAPRAVAESLAARVVGDVPGPLVAHPPAARGRRLVRAVATPVGVAVLALLAGQPWVAALCGILAVLAVPLGLDRYRQLGHVTDGERLSVRSGSLRRRQVVVEHGAVVGWRVRRTLFQRRLGLATLIAAVGAGDGGYAATDMAEEDALALAAAISPAWVTPFLEVPPESGR
ncbi:putative membrane protein [Actinomadura pelletieri DSM 43383]|uniref:Putative membrane protein n=1 Tax=Actinomadura pelletieri DSM 43383 TaxID=1120940 RepID=A0A495QB20_9ACTN|nr:PH domain-containing protein [Actinomadura pelletieri]RKS68767.1 putative membrane protein [Actinomadura pelletieri DSM 43383]